jgi:uncharacterized membrane protein (GlpM family)
MFDYLVKFLIGGMIVVLATYFSKTKNIFLSGIITTLPIVTLLNMMLQVKYLNTEEFHNAQKSGIVGAVGLALFIASCYVLTNWMKPVHAILLGMVVLFLYFFLYKLLAN